MKRAETERRLRVMAKAKVDMLFGTYQWPDGRPALRPDGSPNVSHAELLRLVGYSTTYRNHMKILFADPYFEDQMRLEVARREKAALPTLANQGRIRYVRDLFVNDLELRLTKDPSSFSNAQIITAVKELSQLIPDDERVASTQHTGSKANAFNAFFTQQNLTVMNQAERERFVETAADAADERLAQLQRLVDNANVVEVDADDSDVIDAEVDPE